MKNVINNIKGDVKMHCSKCGKEIDNNSVFCQFCGNRISPSEGSNSSENQYEEALSNIEVESPTVPTGKFDFIMSIIHKYGKLVSIIGIVGFLLITVVGLIGYGEVYFYNGYGFTKILSTICLVLLILGTLLIIADNVLPILLKKESCPKVTKKQKIFSICTVVISIIFSVILITNAVDNKPSNTSSKSSSASSYEMTHDVYCMLYMKISNVKIKHSGSYTYVSGTITNNGSYRIKYVKVKAVCKGYSGQIIDTDWTYAVDSSWLDPGESKTFEMMIKDTNNQIKTADVSVIYE